jgi:CDP-diacylglycerol--glycerol-3-phosphate 3-phosphatidyltransferase
MNAPTRNAPDLSATFARWSALHGNAEVRGIVKGWLYLSFIICRPLVKTRVTPNLLSMAGVVASVAIWPNSRNWWGLVFLAISILFDGLDGTLAIMTNTDSIRGAMVDSICDRISEIFWMLAFYQIGAPVWVIGTAWVVAFTQEYARARIAGLGDYQIDVVTIAERPVRAAFLCVALVAYLLNIHLVTTVAWVWLIFQVISLMMVARSGFRRLR